MFEGKSFIGNFRTEQDAARAYDAKAIQVYRSRALLNFHDVHGETLEKLKLQERQRGVMPGRGSSSFRGVSAHGARWRATFRRQFVGIYGDEVEAVMAYDDAAKLTFGQNAILNFP
eukprot:SAG11_NODE_12698_length_690_cov_0.702200_2_plen_115_part_01